MAARFTTDANILKRLTGRVETAGTTGGEFGVRQIDPATVTQIHDQADSRVFNAVSAHYQTPLLNVHPFLAELTEKLAVCDLLPIYYQGKAASDDGYLKLICTTARDDLKALMDGEITLPGELPTEEPEPGKTFRSKCVKIKKPQTFSFGKSGRNVGRFGFGGDRRRDGSRYG